MSAKVFGTTWWGEAWLTALEERALEDPNRLPRGRTYARQGRVTEMELSPGALRAVVHGTETYASALNVRLLDDAEWDEALGRIMARAANAAALLSGEVPTDIADLVLPGHGDLGPACSCPDTAEPCKHAAALCYVAADLLDADPFALLTLRGRDRDTVLTEVRRRRAEALGLDLAASSHLPRGADPGVPASAAFGAAAERSSADARPTPVVGRPTPRTPAGAYRLVAPGPADSGIDDDGLRALVLDGADRAWRMLALAEASGLTASVGEDVVRRAARLDPDDLDRLAEVVGLGPDELAAAARGWRVGGRAGYRVTRDRWDPPAAVMALGADALGPGARIRGNRVSVGPDQLRLDTEGHWWRFAADDKVGWLLLSGPAVDPAELLDL
ncbi:MAG: SWIM zinc finger family protein [Actinomycetota bacterium]